MSRESSREKNNKKKKNKRLSESHIGNHCFLFLLVECAAVAVDVCCPKS